MPEGASSDPRRCGPALEEKQSVSIFSESTWSTVGISTDFLPVRETEHPLAGIAVAKAPQAKLKAKAKLRPQPKPKDFREV